MLCHPLAVSPAPREFGKPGRLLPAQPLCASGSAPAYGLRARSTGGFVPAGRISPEALIPSPSGQLGARKRSVRAAGLAARRLFPVATGAWSLRAGLTRAGDGGAAGGGGRRDHGRGECRAAWGRGEPGRWGLHSASLVSSPRCSAGRPDPQGLHRPQLPPGPPLARAEDPRGPQHAGPQVPWVGGRGGSQAPESRSLGWETQDRSPGCRAEDAPGNVRSAALALLSCPQDRLRVFLGTH